ncbi:MAG TPA: hypothetical protein VK146_08865 [Tabrizicola sp.]|nr:hypothetical protein [Tabrizicola sp.]
MAIYEALQPTPKEGWGKTILLPMFFSGFGAFAGGFVAFKFRKREEGYRRNRENLEKLARVCALSSALCGTALANKKQLIKPTVDRYFQSRNALLSELGIPKVQKELVLDFHLLTFSAPATSPKDLLDAVLSLGKGDGRKVPQAIALLESYNNLDSLCVNRNEWIEKFEKAAKSISNEEKMQRYYSVPDGQGTVDARYLHMIEGLRDSIDSIIFHSFEVYRRTALSLLDQSAIFQTRYRERFGFHFSDFSREVGTGLFPPRDNYPDWLNKPIEYKRRWFEKKKSHLEKLRTAIKSGYGGDL